MVALDRGWGVDAGIIPEFDKWTWSQKYLLDPPLLNRI